MNTVIVYYSHSNNTRTAAELLGSNLNVKVVELKEVKKGNVIQALLRRCSKLQDDPWKEIEEAKLVYLMYPIWAGHSVPAMNAFVSSPKAKFQGKEVIIVTFMASPEESSSSKAQDHISNFVRKSGGVVRSTYAIQGGSMNVFIGDEKIKERMDQVRWDEL